MPGINIKAKSLGRENLKDLSVQSQEIKIKLLDQIRQVMRLHHYSIHTERTYLDWIKRYIEFHRMKSREDLAEGEKKIEAFLSAVNPLEATPESETPAASPAPQKLPAQGSPAEKMQELLRIRHYSYRTEQSYLDWVRRYLAYAGHQHLVAGTETPCNPICPPLPCRDRLPHPPLPAKRPERTLLAAKLLQQ